MNKIYALLTVALTINMTGCSLVDGLFSRSSHAAFDDAVAQATTKNLAAMKEGYAWTSTAVKNKYGNDKTEEGKAYKASEKRLSLVDVAIFEGEQALAKGDEETAMKKAAFANELADAQLAQKEISSNYQILWR